MRMPLMDGFETADLIRQRRETELTPIIFITAHAEGEVPGPDRYSDGPVDFMFAPVSPEALRAKVSTCANLFIRMAELAARAQPAQRVLVEGTETILYVEDNDTLRPLVTDVLEGFGYTVWTACDGTEAITNASESRASIDLLLTDMAMPGINGEELAETLTESHPGLKVLFTSGYPAGTVVGRGTAETHAAFIQKPFLAKELARKIRTTLDANRVTHS
jgi:CheY-like chemotaxis protein